MARPGATRYDKRVADYIKKNVKAGVKKSKILAAMQNRFSNPPRNRQTLYRLYGADMNEAEVERDYEMGTKANEMALEGDFRSLDLVLRAQSGWSPKETQETRELEDEEDTSAMDELMALLGKELPDGDEEVGEEPEGSRE